jgi:protoporphyrinogen oxidase
MATGLREVEASPFAPPCKSKSVAVLGGGMTGLIAARYLSDHPDLAVDLYERADRLGGLHNSVEIDGKCYDVGAYAFGPENPIFEAFPGIIDHYKRFRPSYRTVLDGGEIDGFPRTLHAYARLHGKLHMIRAVFDLLLGKLLHWRQSSVPAYCKYYLGRSFYRNSGLRNYIERLFARPDHALDVQFARQRLQDIATSASLRSWIRAALNRKPAVRRQPMALARPEAGFDQCYDMAANALRDKGVDVRTGCSVLSITRRDGKFVVLTAAGEQIYDRVVSTIPVPALARLLGIETEARFETMKLVTLFYRHHGDWTGYPPSTYLYNFSHSGRWKRVIDFSTIYGGNRWLSVEITRPGDELVDAENERQDFETTARKLGLFPGALDYQDFCITPNAYPVFDRDGQAALERDRARIEALGIDIVGRQGRFEYISSAQAAEDSRAVVEAMQG